MSRLSRIYDTHSDLLLQRYKQGIQLVKPSRHNETPYNSVSRIYSFPVTAYFNNGDTQIVGANDRCIQLSNADSLNDLLGKSPRRFTCKKLADKTITNNNEVMRKEAMIVVEESGMRFDDFSIQVLSFKFPWYYEDKVIGIFGLSIMTDQYSLSEFANTMSQIISTGLLGIEQSLVQPHRPNHRLDTVNLSKRELEVVSHLVRGRTAKEVAARMFISRRTVESHWVNIKTKTGCHTKSDLIDQLYKQ